jgi:osmotically-inducible protein OsmY
VSNGQVPNRRSQTAAVLVAAFAAIFLSGCAPSTPVQKAGHDQDIARDINWELRRDIRFTSINAFCIQGVVTLEGRVDNKQAESDAIQVANAYSRGAHVVSKLEVRAR